MDIKFTNGATVHRFYKGDEVGELLAAFQYTQDAKAYAEDRIAKMDRTDGISLLVVDHCKGSTQIFKQSPSIQEQNDRTRSSLMGV